MLQIRKYLLLPNNKCWCERLNSNLIVQKEKSRRLSTINDDSNKEEPKLSQLNNTKRVVMINKYSPNPRPLNPRPVSYYTNTKEEINRNQRRPNTWDSYSRKETTNELLDKENNLKQFEATCEEIKKCLILHDTNLIPPKSLVNLPMRAVHLNRENYFLQEISTQWWTAISQNNFQYIVLSDFIKFSFSRLVKIDEITKGSLVNKLGFETIFKMAQFSLSSPSDTSPDNFHLLLQSIRRLTVRMNETEKNKINELVFHAFHSFISSYGRNNFTQYYTRDIGHIVFELVQLGVKKPEEVCLVQLISIFCKLFDEANAKRFTPPIFVNNFDKIALALLYWNVDPSKYVRCFWPFWFEKVSLCYNMLSQRNGLFNALILKEILYVTLKFNQEQQFMKVKSMWFSGLKLNKDFIKTDYIKDLVNQINIKYSQHPDKFDKDTVEKILNALQN